MPFLFYIYAFNKSSRKLELPCHSMSNPSFWQKMWWKKILKNNLEYNILYKILSCIHKSDGFGSTIFHLQKEYWNFSIFFKRLDFIKLFFSLSLNIPIPFLCDATPEMSVWVESWYFHKYNWVGTGRRDRYSRVACPNFGHMP